tara:strand:- start:2652 stop:2999 length:348 start_codon:yes stop_codon:yes gene_type:complete
MNPRYLEENIKTILDGHYNTYTYTKSLFEKTMNMTCGDLPCCIVRPSMVGPSHREPYPGWIDSLAALSAPIYFGGLGVFNYFLGDGSHVMDMTAVDQVCNHILIATAYCGRKKET